MILGASILQLPAILKAKEMGIQVIAVDMDRNAVGFEYADISLEISTIDIPKVVEAAKVHKIDGVMTLASDMPMRTVAAVAKELGIVGISEETALKATNKAIMRQSLKDNNVLIPKFYRVRKYEEYLKILENFNGKVIVKPADNSGSRGVILIEDISNLHNIEHAFQYSNKYSRDGEIVVEEYMEGPEVSVEALSVDGEVHIIAITDKLTTGAPNFVEMGHSQPSHLPEEVKNKIRQLTIQAVKAIGIENGPSHTEIIVTKEGPKIVEIGARLGGDNITTHLVPLSTGVNMVKCCIQIALGDKPDFKDQYAKGAAIRYFKSGIGRIIDISNIEYVKQSFPQVQQISFVKNVGDYVGKVNSSSDRIGFIITQGQDVYKAIEVCNEAINHISIKVEGYKDENLDSISG